MVGDGEVGGSGEGRGSWMLSACVCVCVCTCSLSVWLALKDGWWFLRESVRVCVCVIMGYELDLGNSVASLSAALVSFRMSTNGGADVQQLGDE